MFISSFIFILLIWVACCTIQYKLSLANKKHLFLKSLGIYSVLFTSPFIVLISFFYYVYDTLASGHGDPSGIIEMLVLIILFASPTIIFGLPIIVILAFLIQLGIHFIAVKIRQQKSKDKDKDQDQSE